MSLITNAQLGELVGLFFACFLTYDVAKLVVRELVGMVSDLLCWAVKRFTGRELRGKMCMCRGCAHGEVG